LDELVDPFSAVRLACGQTGGFFVDMAHHAAAYLPGDGARLVVTFDNLAARRETEDRFPWGHTHLLRRGWDVLGIMSKQPDWFRHSDVLDFFDSLRDEGFFRRFGHVALYGSSTGGYGALAFAPAAPGRTVMAFAPQTTLAPELVPFERRYRYGRGLGNWSGRYLDGAQSVESAGRVYLCFDPLEPLDRAHVDRLSGPNVVRLPMVGVGHKIPPQLLKMGILKPLVDKALAGALDPNEFSQLYRARKNSVPWLAGLLERALRTGHIRLGQAAAELAMREHPHWKIKHQLAALRAASEGLNTDSART
jgi:hypothetical protein